MTDILTSVEQCVDRTIAVVGRHLVMGVLDRASPSSSSNVFYHRVADPSLSLHIVTALCLEIPRPAK
ncbi:MAG: hypothetical protein R3E50_04590 [Halioglobus sp.]